MTDDPQDQAETLDEDVVDDVEDRTGDEYGEGLPRYPPDRPLGVNTVGVTAVEEDAGESFAERSLREEPDDAAEAGRDGGSGVGQLVEPNPMSEDREERAVADAVPGGGQGPEESALHVEPD